MTEGDLPARTRRTRTGRSMRWGAAVAAMVLGLGLGCERGPEYQLWITGPGVDPVVMPDRLSERDCREAAKLAAMPYAKYQCLPVGQRPRRGGSRG
jgi:hypothetical protein